MTRRSRKQLEKDVFLLELAFEEAFKGIDGLYPKMTMKELYEYEKALLVAKRALKPFSWELKHL